QWEKRNDTEDVDKIKKEVDKQLEQAKQSTAIEIEKANAKAQEALVKAGTIPDASKLSDQIKTLILNSPDLSRKVTETFNNADNGDTIYSKIVSKVATNFATTAEVGGVYDRVNNLSDKIAKQTVEFNKLTESNKLYERILGTSETGAPDQLSRLVMSSQIFQTEVGKYSASGGPNMLRNSRADDGLKYWTEANGRLTFTAHQFYLNGQKRMFSLRPGAFVRSPRFIIKQNTNYMLNLIAFDANTARFKIAFCKRRKGSTNDFDEMQIIFDKTGTPAFNSDKAVKKSFSFNTGAFDEGYLLFNYQGNPNGWSGLFMTELDFYEGSSDRLWQPSPDDSLGLLEAVRTQVTQLAGSYSIKNINSAGDILGQLNLNKDGSIKLNEALIAIGEKTYVKDGVIKKAMIGNGQIGTAHIGEIDANIARLINVSAKNIVSDGLTANIIRGGVLASKNGKLNFDLDNSALESTSDESVIKRIGSGTNFPTQFLKFSKGWVQGRSQPVGLTILGSNRYGDGRSEDGNSGGFAGIRIWNGSNAEGYADSVDVVGDEIVLCDSPFQNRNGWLMKTTYSDTSLFSITNKRNSRIYAGDFLFEKAGGGNASLRQILWQIGDNIAQLYKFRAQNNEGTPGWNDTNKWGWS
ncbi:MAG: gp58-like family protein, partial [Streptococcus sp.]|uniref:gp58-like family protein n=1 Tax=Streptococcus sp. TaxID=1306 RepID=UPI0029099065